ncbi:MAG TPA: hypothetical protein VGC07_02245 [Granulicella sp.]
MIVTLVLTRKPNDLFHDPDFNLNGRFGTLVALSGPRLASVSIVARGAGAAGAITVPTGVLELVKASGEIGDVREVGRFTTMERMDGFIQLRPRPAKAYPILFEPDNSAVQELAKVEKSTDGRCFHVQIPHVSGEGKLPDKEQLRLKKERGFCCTGRRMWAG